MSNPKGKHIRYWYIFFSIPILLVGIQLYINGLPASSGGGLYMNLLNILTIKNNDFSVSFDVNKWNFTADGDERCWQNEAGGWCSESKAKRATTMGAVSYTGTFSIKEQGKIYDASASIYSVLGDKNALPTMKCVNKELITLCERFQSSVKFYYLPGTALLWIYPGVEIHGPDWDTVDKPYMELVGVEWQSGTMNFIAPLGCSEFNPKNESESINKCLQKRLSDNALFPQAPESFRSMQDVRLKDIIQHAEYKAVEASGITGVMPWFFPTANKDILWYPSLFRS